jgi:hypothetical protein
MKARVKELIMIKKSGYIPLAWGLCLAMAGLAQAQSMPPDASQNAPAFRAPPPEAINACKGKASGAACEFTGRRGESLAGTCFSPPPRPAGSAGDSHSNAASLACRPSRGPDGRGGPGEQGVQRPGEPPQR